MYVSMFTLLNNFDIHKTYMNIMTEQGGQLFIAQRTDCSVCK
jgi:hypothetical protein